MKVGNTYFNEKALKGVSWKQFKKTFAGMLSGVDIKVAYKLVTGKKAPDGKVSKPAKKS